MAAEWMEKEKQVRRLLGEKGIDALLLRRVSSFAWITGGAASYVSLATEIGPSAVLVTPEAKYVLTNNIEAVRLRDEERLAERGFELVATPWYEYRDVVSDIASGLQLGCDGPHPGSVDLSAEVRSLRTHLMPGEIERYRRVGLDCGEVVEAAACRVNPGMSEYQIAGLVAHEAYARSIVPLLTLIAVDDRIYRFRHPLPTGAKLDRYAMLVLGGQRHGLVASVSRLVHFGSLSPELRRRAEAVARVDAVLIGSTRPGMRVAEIFQRAQRIYSEVGFPEEWKLHHQGGAAGYEAREYKALPNSAETVDEGQAFAWNPSICGTKSEDTLIVGDTHNEIITATGSWPQVEIEVDNQIIVRPTILEVR